jgi:hypothetical protein
MGSEGSGSSTTLLKEIWYIRNDRIHSKEDGLSLTDQHVRQSVTDFYANKEALIVTEEEWERLYVSLEERLQMNTNLLVLWLQTAQLISNRQLPYCLRQTTARLSLYKFFNRVRPPELDEASLHDRVKTMTLPRLKPPRHLWDILIPLWKLMEMTDHQGASLICLCLLRVLC